MATISVPDEVYERLAAHAAAAGTTADEYAVRYLTQWAAQPVPVDLPFDEWLEVHRGILARAAEWAKDRPAGHEVDVSREAMYPEGYD